MTTPTIRQIRCFLELCRDFHFTRAAQRMGMAQPPFSRNIMELERVVGAPLFARDGRTVTLTSAGEVFLKSVFQIPSAIERAVIAARRAAGGERSLLRIGFVGALLGEELLGVFERFRSEQPDTQLVLEDLSPRSLLEQVARGDLDGAFLGVRPRELPESVECVAWREEALRVCAPLGHPLAGRKQVRIGDIADQPLIALSEKVAPAYREVIDGLYRESGYAPSSVQECGAVAAVIALVVSGCGIALLPDSALRVGGASKIARPLLVPAAKLSEVFVFAKGSAPALARFTALLDEGD